MFAIMWEFVVKPEHRDEFLQAYGPGGDWAQLFRRCEGFVEVELFRDAEQEGRCITIDWWRRPEQYVKGMGTIAGLYQTLDQRCAQFTLSERHLGNFIKT